MDDVKNNRIKVEEDLIRKIQNRVIYHANVHRHSYEVGKAVMEYMARDILADIKAAGGLIPPVKLGAEVWVIHRGRPKKAVVQYIGAGADGSFSFVVFRGRLDSAWSTAEYSEYQIGTSVFLTEEDAQKPEGYAVELADAVIRIADLCGHLGIDLGEVLELKMKYNEGRPYKHGKQF